MKAARITAVGGPEAIEFIDVDLPPPGPGEVQVRQKAAGLNYIDVYHRTGLYPVPLPSGLGLEAAGIIEKVGPGVVNFKVGDRIAYGTGPIGAYAEMRNLPAARIVPLPDGISNELAAAIMLKGMTARYLLKQTYPVKNGDWILVHAAAGGVGQILCQWAKKLGAHVIGTAGGPDVAIVARTGADHVIDYAKEDVAKRVREITQGEGVAVSYDGVGQATMMASLDSLRPRGVFVSFGNASGPIKNFDLMTLSARGSLYVTRPTLNSHVATEAALRENAADLFLAVTSGAVKIDIAQRYKLTDAAQAHRDLEARRTTGSTILLC